MKRRKKITRKKSSSRAIRERDPIPWKYCVLTLVCGLLLVTGFFWAAKFHFNSLNTGIENSDLRKKLNSLKNEKRHLTFKRERALSEIDKAARKIGFKRRSFRNIEVVRIRNTESLPADQLAESRSVKAFTSDRLARPKLVRLSGIEKKVAKTSSSKPVKKSVKRNKNGESETRPRIAETTTSRR